MENGSSACAQILRMARSPVREAQNAFEGFSPANRATLGSACIGGAVYYPLRSRPVIASTAAMFCCIWSYLILRWIVFAYTFEKSLLDAEDLAEEDSIFDIVDGIKVHFRKTLPVEQSPAQSTEGTVLYHGFGASLFSFRDVQRELADALGMTTVSFDFPGFGLTQRPSGGFSNYSLRRTARVGNELSRQQGFEKVVLVGHSMGAFAACMAAVMEPERIRALVLISPAVPVGDARVRQMSKNCLIRNMMRLIAGFRSIVLHILWYFFFPLLVAFARSKVSKNDFWRSGLEYAAYDKKKITPKVVDGYSKPTNAKAWDWGVISFIWGQMGAPFSSRGYLDRYFYDEIAERGIPTLVIHGENDRVVPIRIGENVSKRISSSRFVSIRCCGHLPQEEEPQQVVEEVRSFLAESCV
ncbi:hypothetical protein NDN08_006859 [Rhodosorus marinus]|uniref:AB hydrolase-1 domain-containing protein n=1 Tax=Rhodosorus marinus TaxID=101924 RepID=A0AAV8UKB1_9RHOD|nr:hypothetical protein NDN08_006859 [Rhodosorus marinus]